MLEAIIREKYQEVEEAKKRRPLSSVVQDIQPAQHLFREALTNTKWALIAECKLASPVKGIFSPGRKVAELASIYGAHGATACSILTDKHFQGCLEDLAAARAVCNVPLLRKDFIVDTYQIYEARAAQADAVLLIASVLPDEQLKICLETAHDLGLDCLVEVHSLTELQRVLQLPAEIIGINNRDLTTFVTDINHTRELMPYCDKERLIISESGIRTVEDVRQLKSWGVRGILVGEGLVTAQDIGAHTRELVDNNTAI